MKKLFGNILCNMGFHDLKFSNKWKGYFRPNYTCKRKGCGYWME